MKRIVIGVDRDGKIRIVENPKNDFFMGTLFVPQSRAERDPPHPVIRAFVEASIRKGS
jgi:CTP synthase (UTP-ammonia lyase)